MFEDLIAQKTLSLATLEFFGYDAALPTIKHVSGCKVFRKSWSIANDYLGQECPPKVDKGLALLPGGFGRPFRAVFAGSYAFIPDWREDDHYVPCTASRRAKLREVFRTWQAILQYEPIGLWQADRCDDPTEPPRTEQFAHRFRQCQISRLEKRPTRCGYATFSPRRRQGHIPSEPIPTTYK
ncbi:hypothetical protein CPLU01_01863 [Colletotrichum plurivorum]|uniref:Uncharacterized protein n=1 Tax=Colletotrichum plurivorum TaxID=2175906 RepID=A0A8H6KY69_9PEZI|nr:hypothetical protein CPLU01_01863 [Colletotrichum plurivorum]